jgi:mRNA interferase YafQ
VRNPVSEAQFRRDVKLAQKRDHPLGGDWKHHRDCHIEPDWLLIYKLDGDDLYLVRTGTHSDLF